MEGLAVLRPLRHRDFRLLALGSAVSLFGDGLFLSAIALQVYALRGLPSAMSVVGVVVATSQVSLLLVGGWAADRFDRRMLLVGADLVRAVAMGTLGALSVAGLLELWHVWVLVALQGMGTAFFNPASTALVPELLDDDELPRANALLGTVRPVLHRLVGPTVGGLVVAAAGPGVAFLVDGGTFVFSAAMLLAIGARPASRVPSAGGPELSGVTEGFRFVRSHAWCWAWLIGQALSVLAFLGPFEVLMPYVLRFDPRLGLSEAEAARQVGLVFGLGGLGAICVSLVAGQRGLPRRYLTLMYVAEAAGVGLLAVFGLMTSLWQALLASMVMHGAYAFTDIAWTSLLQRRVPRALLGRVSSLDWLVSIGLVPLSFAVAGPLAERLGPREVLVGGGVLGAVVLLALLALVPGATAPERETVVLDTPAEAEAARR